ncbi:MAG TPA: ERV1/ALR-related protein [Candidatus Sulfopaludibacter sp.]|nr:ERV1/ALR-related protein [Candidatus Sulfopaludibacter sp.]
METKNNRTMLPVIINLNNNPPIRSPRGVVTPVVNFSSLPKLELKLPSTYPNQSVINSAPNPSVVNSRYDPKQFFPQNKQGWDILFTKAKNAKTLSEKESFKNFLNNEVRLPCGSCAQHTKYYLSTHDIREYYYVHESINGTVQEIGLFKYIWMFKNEVNKRINKPQITLLEAYKLYY